MLPLSLPLHSNLFNMEQTRQEFRWPACLAVRENLLPSGVPYIPILIEDIFRYVSLIDYEQNCIKTVHTIGEILPDATRFARLRSISSHSDTEITLSLEKLPVHAVYFKDEKGRHLHIWEKACIFKVFGTLERRKDEVVLMAHKLLKVQDVRGSLNTLSLLSTAVHPMYYQYKQLK